MHRLPALRLATLLASLTICSLGCQPQDPQGAPSGAVVVVEGVHSRQGVGEFTAFSILDRQTIAKLEAFFPGYRDCPSSQAAGGWEAGYEVYFNFADGRALRVMVSENGGGDTWSMGSGDFATQGDFQRFVDDLRAGAAHQPSAAGAELQR